MNEIPYIYIFFLNLHHINYNVYVEEQIRMQIVIINHNTRYFFFNSNPIHNNCLKDMSLNHVHI